MTTDIAILDALLAELRELDRKVADLESLQSAARDAIRREAASLGAHDGPVVRPLATIQFAAASERVTYDRKALDTLCRDDADLAFRLAPYRKTSQVAPALRIVWAKGGAS